MIKVEHRRIIIDKDDFGLPLTFIIKSGQSEIIETDKIRFVTDKLTKEMVLNKDENDNLIFILQFTEEEAKSIDKGIYKYQIKAYRDNIYLNTIVSDSLEIR